MKMVPSKLLAFLLAQSSLSFSASVPLEEKRATQTFFNVGQNYVDEWNNFARGTGKTPSGISVYGDIWSGALNADSQTLLSSYAQSHSGYVEVGMSWKDAMTFNGYTQYQGAQLCNDISGGKFDSNLQKLASYLGQFKTVNYLLRVDYEVSGNFHANTNPNAFDQSTFDLTAYPKAFSHVRQVMGAASNGAKIQYVFHAVRSQAKLLYPGDAVVDYVGVSVFNNDVCLPDGPYRNCDGQQIDPNLAGDLGWSPKPKIIAESAVQPPASTSPDGFIDYLTRVKSLVKTYDIAGWTYINSNWPAHNWTADVWGDSRIEANAPVLAWFNQNIASDPRYVFG